MKIYTKIDQLIGKTPILEVANIEKEFSLKAKVLIKIESFNPAGSVKDRTALFMLKDAEKKGLIKDGATIIEPTSGNTGIGLASIGASRGYKVILTMPDTMSLERRKLLAAYGAEVVLTDGKLGMAGAIEKAKEIQAKTPNSFIPSQFDNSANIDAHYYTTAPEIYEDLDGRINLFVAGVGTGGTITGSAKYFKEKNKKIEIIAVEPASSPMISEGRSGAHKIQGIGANFVPQNFDKSLCDRVETVTDEDAIFYAKLLAKKEGLLVGISAGASLSVAIKEAKREENAGKTIVALLADTGERYLSTELFE
ncbi:MAG: cysteine synthase A [Clostridia bacterium]|nr:cysteine synthase A [Clostridia bacterium]